MPGTRAGDDHAARYSALYREHNGGLVAYARSLTGDAAVAEDLAAEAHFRVWRRIQAGYEVDNVAAYLTTTVRNLAAGLSRARREFSRDAAELPLDPSRDPDGTDPERRASHVDLISRLLKELPERSAKALWYAEVEDLTLDEVGERIGAGAGTTAVVLTRARERLRQAFLQSQPGTPPDVACEPYWKQLPAVVRRTASPRRAKSVIDHCDECADCHARMLALTEANTRLPALLGPAILAGVLGGGSWLLPTVTGATATAGVAATGTAARTAARTAVRTGSKARHARISPRTHVRNHGLSPARAVVIGSAAAVGLAATVATLALGSTGTPNQTPAALPPMTAPAAVEPSGAAGGGTPSSAATTTGTTASTVAQPTSSAPASTSAPRQTTAANSVTSQPASATTTTDPTTAAAAPTTSSTTPATSASPSASSSPTIGSGPILLLSPSASSSTSASPTESASASPTPSPTATSASPSASASDTASATESATASDTPTIAPSPSLTPTLSPSSSTFCTFSIIGLCATENPSVD